MENMRNFEPNVLIHAQDLPTYEGIAMILEGLKRIPVQASLTIHVDESTQIHVVNVDGVGDHENEFEILMHHDCVDCCKHVNLTCPHDNRKFILDLADAINNPDDSRLLRVLYAAPGEENEEDEETI